MSKQEGMPQPEPKPEKKGVMTPEEVAAAKADMDKLEYIGGKFVKRGSESHRKATEQKAEQEKAKEDAAKQREEIIDGLVQHQIEENPNAIIDKEQAKKYWGRFYDQANQGAKNEMQIHELYAQKYEQGVEGYKNEILVLEQKLILAESKKEKEEITEKIKKLEEDIEDQKGEIHARRGYGKPKKEKGEK
ncbi:MAG: hypothetical protein EXS48_02605 [Candidatus Staskawiczbacteria bacterium]|nr:hypothetical protein [Candidatus Staskawiczbacteria bacterium]